jgi:hypothetical protein
VELSLALDIIVAVLLVVTIAYAMVLNRRLDVLRKNKAELEALSANFGEATSRAGDSIQQLRDAAQDLYGTMKKADSIHDDLIFMVERGGTSADRLEEAIRGARGVATEQSAAPEPNIEPQLEPNPEPAREPRRPARAKRNGAIAPTVAERALRSRRQSPAPADIAARAVAKSQAEEELLLALQAAR